MTKRAYQKKWRREHPHYSRDQWRRKKQQLNALVLILGVKVRWRYLEARS